MKELITTVVNINGELYFDESLSEAKISIFDRGFLFGDSVYEVTCTHDGIPLKLHEHLDRLWYSASRLDLTITLSRQEISYQINKTLRKLNQASAYIRFIVTRGEGEIGLDPRLSQGSNFIVIAKTLPENPKWWYTKGVEVIIAGIQRTSRKSVDPNVKSGNYLNNVLAYSEAKKAGAFDAIMLNHQGMVSEGTTSNIWIVKDNQVKTPPLKSGLLEGITRKTLLEISKQQKISISEVEFGPDELLDADECFLTSSTKRIVPITKIDNKIIGKGKPGTWTKKLSTLYEEHIRESIASIKKDQNQD